LKQDSASKRTNERTMTETITSNYWTATAAAAMNMTCGCGDGNDRRPITIRHDDGRVYHGHVNEHGEKHGQGTLKMDVCVTGTVGDEGSHTTRWTEFSGSWRNGVMHGYGVMRRMTERGVDYVVHDGMWDDGVPVLENMNGEDPEEEDPEEEDPEEEYYRGCSSPKYGDYDHHEEAS
jgi:hypothetical protein